MMAGYAPANVTNRGLIPAGPGKTEVVALCASRKTQSGFAATWYGCEPASRDQ
jgi:ATP/maltotriose-dependent transcriptional regulator MalT